MGLGGDSGEKHGEAEEVPRLADILLRLWCQGLLKASCPLSHTRHPSAFTPLACLSPEGAWRHVVGRIGTHLLEGAISKGWGNGIWPWW